MFDVSARFLAALARPHEMATRLEVWVDGERVADSAPFTDGTVTDKWGSGIRRSLSLTVPPTDEWRAWLARPMIELRPWRGIRFGASGTELVPLGRFSAGQSMRTTDPRKSRTVAGNDLWTRAVHRDFLADTPSYDGHVVPTLVRLLTEAGLGDDIQVLLSSTAFVPAMLWDKPRAQVITELASSIGAEVYVDRYGRAVIRRIPEVGTPVVRFPASGGTLIGLESETDWQTAFNVVVVTGTNTAAPVAAQAVQVTDQGDPAHPRWIGERVKRLGTPLVTTEEQARAYARARLAAYTRPSRSVALETIVNPALDAGDTVQIDGADLRLAQLTNVTIPLVATGSQQLSAAVATGEG